MASPVGTRPMTRGQSLLAALADPRWRAWRLFLRFGVVGLLNAAFGYAVFATLLLAGLWPGAALVAATVAGVAFNFQTSRRLVFRSRGRVVRFIAMYGAVLVLNWVALRALHGIGVPELQAQALLTLPIAALSFFGQRAFVFQPEPGRA